MTRYIVWVGNFENFKLRISNSSYYQIHILVELSKWVRTREPTRPTMGLGRVGLKFFIKFQYGLIFDPVRLEPGSPTRK